MNTFLSSKVIAVFVFIQLMINVQPCQAQQHIRVASYNIRLLNTEVTNQGNRLEKLRDVIALLNADVIGLQEIHNRSALELIFSPDDWYIVIDDDSNSPRNVAAAIRKPLRILNVRPDLDADDQQFLFPQDADNYGFPERRDVLRLDIELPDGSDNFTLLVNHPLSRVQGRTSTDRRREEAATKLVNALRQEIATSKFVYVCDCNDTPDDRSSNILETGNPNARAEMEQNRGSFLVNLMEPLFAVGHVSYGRKTNELTQDRRRIDTIDTSSRTRNHQRRGTDRDTGDILFDQLYASPLMYPYYDRGSAAIFDNPVAVRGNDFNRASDHLPVFADFVLGE